MRIVRRMQARTHGLVAAVLGTGLLILHFDFWRPQRARLWFGVVPEELAWRLAWMLAAFLFILYFTACVWRSEDER